MKVIYICGPCRGRRAVRQRRRSTTITPVNKAAQKMPLASAAAIAATLSRTRTWVSIESGDAGPCAVQQRESPLDALLREIPLLGHSTARSRPLEGPDIAWMTPSMGLEYLIGECLDLDRARKALDQSKAKLDAP